MEIKKFESYSKDTYKYLVPEEIIRRGKLLDKEINSIKDVTDEMVECCLTEDQFNREDSIYNKGKGNVEVEKSLAIIYKKTKIIINLVSTSFSANLNGSLSQNDFSFLKKISKFLRENDKSESYSGKFIR